MKISMKTLLKALREPWPVNQLVKRASKKLSNVPHKTHSLEKRGRSVASKKMLFLSKIPIGLRTY